MTIVDYALDGPVARITLDDGKANVMSLAMQTAIHRALDQAEADRAVVVLAGRDGMFSGGFDLAALAGGGHNARAMVIGGFELSHRILGFERPIVVACTGHAVAMGAFLLLSGDYRIGTKRPAKFTANEVAIGLTMPRSALEVLRQRLTPAAFVRAAMLAEIFTPANAVEAGFLDRVVEDHELLPAALETARRLAELDQAAYKATKLRARSHLLEALRAATVQDGYDLEQFL
jgi:enoyl-CoA hydratase